jgi:hypothetical protein
LRSLPVFIVCVTSSFSFAKPRVVVLEEANQSTTGTGFVTPLKIQTQRVAIVDTQALAAGSSLADHFAAAGELIRGGNVALVVWAEPSAPDAAPQVVIYAVGRDNRALVEVVRVPKSGSPDQDRIVALKVATLLDDVLSAASESASATETFATRSLAGETERRWYGFLRVGGFAAGPTGTVGPQFGVNLAAGPTLRGRRFEGDVYVSGRLVTSETDRSMSGQVTMSEGAFALGTVARLRVGRGAIGADLGLGLRLIDAKGLAVDGREQAVLRAIPTIRLGMDARYRIASRFLVRAFAGAEAAFQRQTFSVVDQPISDLGRVRAAGELELVVEVP